MVIMNKDKRGRPQKLGASKEFALNVMKGVKLTEQQAKKLESLAKRDNNSVGEQIRIAIETHLSPK
jgi:hypothetical protein